MISYLEAKIEVRGLLLTARPFELAEIVVVVASSRRKDVLDLFPVGIRQVNIGIFGT